MALRARDIRMLCREHGTSEGIIMAVEALADEMVGHRENMKTMAELVSQCADNVGRMVGIGEAMKQGLSEIQRRQDQYDAVQSEKPDDA